eukprot:1301763-Amphidinium_carterae.1
MATQRKGMGVLLSRVPQLRWQTLDAAQQEHDADDEDNGGLCLTASHLVWAAASIMSFSFVSSPVT